MVDFPRIGVKYAVHLNGQYLDNDGNFGPKEHAILFFTIGGARSFVLQFASRYGYTVPTE
jgi:hypothetical protein